MTEEKNSFGKKQIQIFSSHKAILQDVDKQNQTKRSSGNWLF